MIGSACDADNGDAHWSESLTQRGPKVRQGALVTSQAQVVGLESKIPALNAPWTRHGDEALQLTKVYSLNEGLVEATTILLKGFDQLCKQLLTLLIPQPQDVPKGVHDGVHAAQPVEISLPVSALALDHQLLFGEGECN